MEAIGDGKYIKKEVQWVLTTLIEGMDWLSLLKNDGCIMTTEGFVFLYVVYMISLQGTLLEGRGNDCHAQHNIASGEQSTQHAEVP